MSEYDPLYDFLINIKDKNEIILTLKQVEEILGKKLPQKAYIETQRWENSDSHTQAKAWLNAGWKVEHPSEVIRTGEVKFIKQLEISTKNILEEESNISNEENNIRISIPCGSLIYCIGIPIIPLVLALYYSSQGKDKIAKTYLNIALLGMGIGFIIYILTIIF